MNQNSKVLFKTLPLYTNLELEDIASLIGQKVNMLPEDCINLIMTYDFSFRKLTQEERDLEILRMIQKIISSNLKISGPKNINTWKKGWKENFDEFIKSNYKLDTLTPKFIKPNRPIRLRGDYVMPKSKQFELNFYEVLRLYLFMKYFKNVDNIYEFGAGTGYNLVKLAQIYPEKNLFGSDWVLETKRILDSVSKRYNFKIQGFLFDFFKPNYDLKLRPNSGVLLVGALEQTGNNYHKFLNYLISQKPTVVVHVDSMNELYNKDKLIDFLALWHDEKRNYIKNYLTTIKNLSKSGKVRILKIQKVSCGGVLHDGYSYDVWKVK